MCKVDLHTHSILSHDGGIDEAEYRKILEKGILDCVAITDHNEVAFAQKLHAKLGEKIIVGEEIATSQGQLIGLFLQKLVPKGLTARKTGLAIRKQGGFVYIPHPFEMIRNGVAKETLEEIIDLVDILEVFNSRTIKSEKSDQAYDFAKRNDFAMASSSDAHGYSGLGVAYSILHTMPTQKNLMSLLTNAIYKRQRATLLSRMTPVLNKLGKLLLR